MIWSSSPASAGPFELDGEEVHVGASIGIALLPRDGLDVAKLPSCTDPKEHPRSSRTRTVAETAFPVVESQPVV